MSGMHLKQFKIWKRTKPIVSRNESLCNCCEQLYSSPLVRIDIVLPGKTRTPIGKNFTSTMWDVIHESGTNRIVGLLLQAQDCPFDTLPHWEAPTLLAKLSYKIIPQYSVLPEIILEILQQALIWWEFYSMIYPSFQKKCQTPNNIPEATHRSFWLSQNKLTNTVLEPRLTLTIWIVSMLIHIFAGIRVPSTFYHFFAH